MESVGYAAMVKDTAVHVTGTWGHNNFVARGFWVDNFIGVSADEGLNMLANGVNEQYGISGFGKAKWMLGMLVECNILLAGSVYQLHFHSIQPCGCYLPYAHGPSTHLSTVNFPTS